VLELGPHAEVTGLDAEADVVGHLRPPVVACNQLQCLPVPSMTSDT